MAPQILLDTYKRKTPLFAFPDTWSGVPKSKQMRADDCPFPHCNGIGSCRCGFGNAQFSRLAQRTSPQLKSLSYAISEKYPSQSGRWPNLLRVLQFPFRLG